jgi:hypothetical protein
MVHRWSELEAEERTPHEDYEGVNNPINSDFRSLCVIVLSFFRILFVHCVENFLFNV